MCGIAGIYYRDAQREVPRETLMRMTAALHHRGPDGEGYHVAGGIGLGHRRLSIIDLTTGDQPMYSDDQQIVIVFNGEIFNYVELRAELEGLGHRFRTTSDTETILRAYEQWGVDCQTHFNGMWAFALYDGPRRRLLLSRDRLGEKPLFYSESAAGLVFGSEIKSLFAGGVTRDSDSRWTEVYCCLGYIPAPHSFFRNVKKLPPGCYLLADPDGHKVQTYWDLPQIEEDRLLTDCRAVDERFCELFRDAVRVRMRSDVPYGAFLSGGLDSGCVVAEMAALSSHPIRTFTIGFTHREYDERRLARLVATAYGTQHVEHVVEPSICDEALENIGRHYDEPFGDASAIPTGYVSDLAARDVKMVLTGDGGDEVLSGYTMYQGERFAQQYGRMPAPLRHALPRLLRQVGHVLRGTPRMKINRAVKVSESSNQSFEERLARKLSRSDPQLVAALLGPRQGRISLAEFIAERMRKCTWRDPFYRLMYYHLKVSLPDDMLTKVDRMSMAHSLETRTPFLDHRLVEFMCTVHKNVKMVGYERKSILRRTVARQLPAALLRAGKRGFAVPLTYWFKDEGFVQRIHDLGNSGNLDLDRRVLAEIVERNRSGVENHGDLLWQLVVLDRIQRGGDCA